MSSAAICDVICSTSLTTLSTVHSPHCPLIHSFWWNSCPVPVSVMGHIHADNAWFLFLRFSFAVWQFSQFGRADLEKADNRSSKFAQYSQTQDTIGVLSIGFTFFGLRLLNEVFPIFFPGFSAQNCLHVSSILRFRWCLGPYLFTLLVSGNATETSGLIEKSSTALVVFGSSLVPLSQTSFSSPAAVTLCR